MICHDDYACEVGRGPMEMRTYILRLACSTFSITRSGGRGGRVLQGYRLDKVHLCCQKSAVNIVMKVITGPFRGELCPPRSPWEIVMGFKLF